MSRAEASGSRLPSGAARAVLAAVLVVAAALRVAALDKPFYVDEITTITVASQPLAVMGETMRLIDASPALYPLLLHGWMDVSRADVWLRLLSAIFGWLAVFVVFRLGARAFGWKAGLAAAAIMAIAPAHVHYAQYVRNYSLFTLLAALHVLLVSEWLDPDGRRTGWRFAGLAVVTTALFYTHYLSLLLLPAEGVFALMRWRTARNAVIGWGATVAVAGVLFLPGVPLLLHNVEFDRARNLDRPEPPPLVELIPTLAAELTVGQRSLGFDDPQVRRTTLVAALVLVPGLALLGLWRGIGSGHDRAILLALVALLPLAIYVGSGRRLVAVRFFLPFMVGYIALAGNGLASLSRRSAVAVGGALVILCAVPLTHFYTSYAWSYDHRRVAAAIGATAGPDDALLTVHPFETLYYRWYLGDALPMQGLMFTPLEDQDTYVIKPPPLDLPRAQARVRQAAARHDRVWIVGQSERSFAFDETEPEGQLLAWLDEHYERVDDLDALTGGDPWIRAYRRPAAPEDAAAGEDPAEGGDPAAGGPR